MEISGIIPWFLPEPTMSQSPPNDQSPPSNKNSNRNIFLRMLAGGLAGCASTVLGVFIFNRTQSTLFGFLPVILTFIVALYISLRFQRRGYALGMIVAPFVIAVIVVVLLLAACGFILIAGSAMQH
jgi:hypothetical protein